MRSSEGRSGILTLLLLRRLWGGGAGKMILCFRLFFVGEIKQFKFEIDNE